MNVNLIKDVLAGRISDNELLEILSNSIDSIQDKSFAILMVDQLIELTEGLGDGMGAVKAILNQKKLELNSVNN